MAVTLMPMESNHPGRASQGDEPGRDGGSQHLHMRRRVSNIRELHRVVTALQGREKGRILRSRVKKKNWITPISLRPIIRVRGGIFYREQRCPKSGT